MADCIFCKIAQGEIPSTKVYEDDQVLAFRDLDPQAPEHVLVIPKKHIASILALGAEDKDLTGHLLTEVIPEIARSLGIDINGFRLVTNTGSDGRTSAFSSPRRTTAHMAARIRKNILSKRYYSMIHGNDTFFLFKFYDQKTISLI